MCTLSPQKETGLHQEEQFSHLHTNQAAREHLIKEVSIPASGKKILSQGEQYLEQFCHILFFLQLDSYLKVFHHLLKAKERAFITLQPMK
jgi:hypothetical protein